MRKVVTHTHTDPGTGQVTVRTYVVEQPFFAEPAGTIRYGQLGERTVFYEMRPYR